MISGTGKKHANNRLHGTILLLALTLTIIVALTRVSAANDESQAVNADSVELAEWNEFGTAWGKYLEYPSTENAAVLYQAIPHWPRDIDNNVLAKQMIDSVYQNLRMLERQAYASDRNAVKVAFRLMRISDGAMGEWLSQMLGNLIRINPRLFLEELKAHREEVIRLDALVGNLGTEFVDNIAGSGLETELRRNALSGVADESLAAVRDECIAELKRQIREEP